MAGNRVKAQEMYDADVGYVSLVPRGANGEPFRVIKSEDAMKSTDLAGYFPVAKAVISIGFVAIAKGFDLEPAKAMITELGLSVTDVEETDAATVFKQEGYADNATSIMAVSDGVLIGLVGDTTKKSFDSYNWESNSFKEVMQQNAAMPMIYIAKSVLGDTIENIVYQGGAREEVVSLVSKAVTDFGAYTTGILKSVPETAFKMEALLHETPLVALKDEEPAEGEPAPASTEGEPTPAEGEGTPAPTAEGEPAAAEAAEGAEGAEGEAVKSDKNLEKLILGLGAAIKSSDANMTKQLTALKEDVSTISGRVAKTESAIKGTLTGDDGQGLTSKSDGEGDGDGGSGGVTFNFNGIDTAIKSFKD